MMLTLAWCFFTLVLRFSDASATSQVTDGSFRKDVLESDIPVLVDFWAPWCGPCRMVAPVVEEIAEQYDGKVKVVKVNTDDNPVSILILSPTETIATQYGIRSIPTLMIFKGGQRVDMVVGAVPKSTLADTLEKHLKEDSLR
ncbi:Thioredoxin [Holothuria leucospilota]|uniref:Thioredoxin n=1 Tax=Holothuria leucospilota TaxID=206669 RepID=A0A9Q1HL29_HOLLE|nr:Thioredoxin [Holothuria leucospilota]